MARRPARTSLAVAVAAVTLLTCASAADALSPPAITPGPAPAMLSPADGARVNAGTELNLTAQDQGGLTTIAVARFPQTGVDGVLAAPLTIGAMPGRAAGLMATPVTELLRNPGVLYWQAWSYVCQSGDPRIGDVGGCLKRPGAVRSLTVIPAPVELTLDTTSPQRVRRSRVQSAARCTTACTLTVTAAASVKLSGRPRAQPRLSFTRKLNLVAGQRMTVRRHFAGAPARTLRSLVRRHGTVRFRLTAVAVDAEGRSATDRATVLVRPTPKVKRRGSASGPKRR